MAESKFCTLIKGHTPQNNYDGYDPHRHWELVKMPVTEYLEKVNGVGLVYPGKNYKDLILSPWQVPWIRDNVKCVGYDFLQEVDPIHRGLYAFGNFHDGVDGQQIEDGPGVFIKTVKSGYKNGLGFHATADIYAVEVSSLVELWQTEQGYAALESLSKAGKVNNANDWKKTLGDNVPQWLFWVMLDRMK